MNAPRLRDQVLRGGLYLSIRQTLGIVINVAGVLLLMRMIGPAGWGVYAAAAGFFTALQLVAQLGINVYLIRVEGAVERAVLDQAATLLLVLATIGCLIGLLLLPLYESSTRLPVYGPALALLPGVPVASLASVPLAHLDRTLDYKRIAWLELTGQACFFVVSVTAAALDRGVWAPVLGWWAQQLVLLFLGCTLAQYRPRPHWDRAVVRDMLTYGTGYSASIWLYQLRRMANPLIVGRYLGAEAVGIVSLCAQIVTHLSFASVATWRLATAALARVQSSRERLLKAINEGMHLQVLAVAPFLLGFAWISPWLMPVLLGDEWRDIGRVFPFIAAGFLINVVFTMHSSAMYVLRQNHAVGATHFVQLAALFGAAALLVPHFGLAGYGIAEIVTGISFLVLHAATVRTIGKPSYRHTLPLTFAAILAMFTSALGFIPLIVLGGTLLVTQPWREVRSIVGELRGALSGS